MIEIKISLQSKQKLFYHTVEKTPVTLYGGAKGGGKSKGVRDIMLLRRLKYPGTHGGLFRRTYKELDGNHIRPMFKEYPMLKDYWAEGKKLLTLPNGSTLEFCHCEREPDVELYQGREFEDLAIEEAGQWTEGMFRTLHGSNRSSSPGFKPRTLLTGNPGGIGHSWLKRLFVERRFGQRERPEDYAFVPALVDDNPALILNDPDYVYRLESEPNEALRKAYRYGSWDIFAGQYFSEISRDVHLIEPFPIPRHWNRFGGYDFGFNHPGAFGWFATNEDGDVFMYREFVKAGLRVDEFASHIQSFSDTAQLSPIVAGWDCWSKKSVITHGTPPTIAEEFANNKLYLTRANIDRIQGASQLRHYLAWHNKPNGKPRLFIFNTCPISFDCMGRMQHNPDNVEDVLKVDATDGDPYSGDDAYDMIRYGLMSRPQISHLPQYRHAIGTHAYLNQVAEDLEKRINEQGAQKEAVAKGEDFLNAQMNDESILDYYINKRKI